MFDAAKRDFGRYYLQKFFNSIYPTNRQIERFVARPFGEACWMAPGRMIDAAEDMLSKYIRKDVHDRATQAYRFPVMIYAFANDSMPTMRDYIRNVADMEYIVFPEDPKERLFGIRQITQDVRAQVCFFAHEVPTVRALAAQFCLFLDSSEGRRFRADYRYAGFDHHWPVQLETPEAMASIVQTEEKNLNILAVDLTLKVTVPLFYAPKAGEPNDGKGTPGDIEDPAGYPLTGTINFVEREHLAGNSSLNLRV